MLLLNIGIVGVAVVGYSVAAFAACDALFALFLCLMSSLKNDLEANKNHSDSFWSSFFITLCVLFSTFCLLKFMLFLAR